MTANKMKTEKKVSNLEPKEQAELGLLGAIAVLAYAWAKKLDAETAILQGGVKPLAQDVPAKAPKPPKVKDAPVPAPSEIKATAPAAPTPAPAPAGVTKEQEEASKKLALDTASAYVRHFSKSVPDGMTRAREVQAEKFPSGKTDGNGKAIGKTIAQLNHEERLAFVAELKKQMEPVGAAA